MESRIGRVLVLGLGKSGKAVARYCAELLGSRVEGVFIAAGERTDDAESFLESIERPGVGWAFGDDALEGPGTGFDLCVASPGIPCWHELYVTAHAQSAELISEVEFAWRESDADSTWVAITGTNGKTTTTALAAHVLRECGFAASAVGNIGDVCLDAVVAGRTEVYVAEVSSYQLYSTAAFAPDVAVMLNITPDHLHWHQTLEAYAEAKFNILRGVVNDASSGTLAILDATNDVVRGKVRELKAAGANYLPLGTAEGFQGDMRARCGARNAAFIDGDGGLVVAFDGAEHAVGEVADLQIKGAHNASNALAAASVAVALGARDADIARALAGFEPLEHRIEPCGAVGGVECFNDSKATNVDATVKALEAFPGQRVVVLLGGDDKGTDLSDLVSACHAHAGAVVCFGAAGPRIRSAFESATGGVPAGEVRDAHSSVPGGVSGDAPDGSPEGFSVLTADHLEDALDVALSAAEPGDVVLLSPACASFDEFRSFEQRGDVFKQIVASRAARMGKE